MIGAPRSFRSVSTTPTEDSAFSGPAVIVAWTPSASISPGASGTGRHIECPALWISCEHFDQPLRIGRLAKELGMSPSGFHAHFKTVTAMSPLQFQKQLRFQEARRLMLRENLDAAQAGYRVDYDDPSHFISAARTKGTLVNYLRAMLNDCANSRTLAESSNSARNHQGGRTQLNYRVNADGPGTCRGHLVY
ncbi:MAG: AraC family transcriptional regulator [Phycisphaerales bacterium]|nr:AraC family transcriptional regulator [Phycisphaerales bacterium]